jgi:hypothetical protein
MRPYVGRGDTPRTKRDTEHLAEITYKLMKVSIVVRRAVPTDILRFAARVVVTSTNAAHRLRGVEPA